MKTRKIEDREFACVADAVAHYGKEGFSTWDLGDDGSRLMRRVPTGCSHIEEVMIVHRGLLDVTASRVAVTV